MSPVHDQSYRRYQGARRARTDAWLVILRAGVRALLGRRVFIGLLVLSWLPFLVRSVQIYLVTTYPQASQILPVNVKMFQSFIELQGLFAFFITIYAGAGLIASDRRARALQLYLSKPLRRMDYILGKAGILLGALGFAVVLPTVLLVVMQVVLSGSVAFLQSQPGLIPAVLLVTLLRVVVPAFAILALSALSTSTRYVAVVYAGLVFFGEAVYTVLAFVTGSTRVAWVSLTANLDVVSDAVFGQPPRYETPVLVSVIVLLAILTVSISVLERQVRGVEVVS